MTRNMPKTRTKNGHMIEILFWVSEKEQFFPFIKKVNTRLLVIVIMKYYA